MSMDAIKQVTDSEKLARERKAQAQAQAQALVDEALKAGQAKLDTARKNAQAQARELLSQAELRGAEQTRSALAEYEKDCEALRAAASERLEEAAELIVRRVVRD